MSAASFEAGRESKHTGPIHRSRREFLQVATAAAFGAAAGFVPAMGAAGESRWRLRLSISSVLFKSLPIEQACERIAQLGFEAIDLWSAYEQCPHLDDALNRLGPEGLRELLAKHKLKLYAFSTYVGGYMKYASLLGKAGGGVAIIGSGPACEPYQLKSRMGTFLELTKPLAETAEKNDSWLAIENHGDSLLDSLDALQAFVDLNRSPRLGIALAPYHLQALGASVEKAIQICGKQLLFFYAWQKREGTGQLPGHGPTDFRPWLKALADIDYGWYVNPFMHGHVEPEAMAKALTKARDYLKQLA